MHLSLQKTKRRKARMDSRAQVFSFSQGGSTEKHSKTQPIDTLNRALATHNIQHTTHETQRTTKTTYDTQHATHTQHRTQHRTNNRHHTTHNAKHTHNTQHTTRNTTRSAQLNTQHRPDSPMAKKTEQTSPSASKNTAPENAQTAAAPAAPAAPLVPFYFSKVVKSCIVNPKKIRWSKCLVADSVSHG